MSPLGPNIPAPSKLTAIGFRPATTSRTVSVTWAAEASTAKFDARVTCAGQVALGNRAPSSRGEGRATTARGRVRWSAYIDPASHRQRQRVDLPKAEERRA